jgi:hypothetical protein
MSSLADLLDRFMPQECANYLANAGYVPNECVLGQGISRSGDQDAGAVKHGAE